MLRIIFIVIFIILVIYCITNKVHFKFDTFLSHGFHVDNSPFGVYCYWSKQGTGKTYNAISFLFQNNDYPIYANVKSIKGLKYNYYSGFNELMKIGTTNSHCIIFFDELFRLFDKDSKLNKFEKKQLKDFLSQMRKRHIIFITTCQEWLDIDVSFRRYVKRDIQCRLISIFGYPIIIKKFYDTTQIRWDNLQNEYVSPILGTYIEHGRKFIVDRYDTFEVINEENVSSYEVFNNLHDSYVPVKADSQLNRNNTNIFINKFNLFNKILSKFIEFLRHSISLYTTTIKKCCVKCHFTKKINNNYSESTSSLHNEISNLDTDFWGNISSDDLN